MYNLTIDAANARQQDLLREADQRRLSKQTRGSKPNKSFFRFVQQTFASQRGNLDAQLLEPVAPAYANGSQIKLDTGVFPAV